MPTKIPIWKWGVFVAVIIFIVLVLIGISGLFFLSPYNNKPSSENTVKKTTTTKNKQPRGNGAGAGRVVFSGTFKLPAGEIVVNRDTRGREGPFKKGHYFRFDQLTPPGRYICVNKDTPSWDTEKKSCVVGPASGDGTVKLMSFSGREMIVKVTIFTT